MIFVNRREGLVPFTSLFREHVKGSNINVEKPRIFVNPDCVVKAPKLIRSLPGKKTVPFKIDKEHAIFAVKAIPNLSKFSKKIDVRDLKRIKRMESLENGDLNTFLKKSNKTIANHLLEKLGKGEDDIFKWLVLCPFKEQESRLNTHSVPTAGKYYFIANVGLRRPKKV